MSCSYYDCCLTSLTAFFSSICSYLISGRTVFLLGFSLMPASLYVLIFPIYLFIKSHVLLFLFLLYCNSLYVSSFNISNIYSRYDIFLQVDFTNRISLFVASFF